MIEINLLPGAGKKARRLGAPSGLSTAFSGVAGLVKDPFMIGAVLAAVACFAFVGFFHLLQNKREDGLRVAEEAAVQDSARFSGVILEKRRALARRDSVLRQVRLIQFIDEDRYLWPHILEEVSKALPQFTWLVRIDHREDVISPAAPMPIDSASLKAALTRADSIAALSPRTDTSSKRRPILLEIKGKTVDNQAMTRFMRDLEASPFLRNVTLIGAIAAVEEPVTLSEFTLHAQYEYPDSAFVQRAPVRITSR